jgi:AAA+ ATPase superfamily predicted ATPase
MLVNPFTPTRIASKPDDFFGRAEELRALERSLQVGSVILEGPIGIGKSSLLSQAVMLMEGFATANRAKVVLASGHKSASTVDDAALLLLQKFVDIDERQKSVSFKIGIGLPKLGLGAEYERKSQEIYRYFATGHHLSALQRIVERECLSALLDSDNLLLLCVDEADKCPVALARLIRSVSTEVQHQGVDSVRFILAGVTPYFQDMVKEDEGIRRFFYKTVTLKALSDSDSADLLHTKLAKIASRAERDRIRLRIHPNVIDRVVSLSGGHPHILQLLGSHLVEHENEDPDGVIDSKDLVNSLRRVCYEDRSQVYESTLHMLDIEGRIDSLLELFEKGAFGFPTRIGQDIAIEAIGKGTVQWFVDHNILTPNDGTYGLVDEFLRIGMLLDQLDGADDQKRLEMEILEQFAVQSSYLEDSESDEGIRVIDDEPLDHDEQ